MTETHEAPLEPQGSDERELFVDFVNTLEFEDGRPVDHVSTAADLRAWLVDHGMCGARLPLRSIEADAEAFRDLRSLLHEVTERIADGSAPAPAQLRRLNDVLRDGMHYHQLVPDADGTSYTVGHVGDELAQARATIAGSLAHYLADHDLRRIRVCANEGCRWRFIDRSPAGRRRWCDMRTCGNRAKVARHRARARGVSA